MTEAEPNHVPATRLEYETGDIRSSYSADRICEGKPIRNPFEWSGSLWVTVSISGKGLNVSGETELKAYRLLPPSLFTDPIITYGQSDSDNPKGGYHGVKVTHGGKTLIMSGPPATFVAEAQPDRPAAQPEAQLSLFEP
jgi:hypothetical protein